MSVSLQCDLPISDLLSEEKLQEEPGKKVHGDPVLDAEKKGQGATPATKQATTPTTATKAKEGGVGLQPPVSERQTTDPSMLLMEGHGEPSESGPATIVTQQSHKIMAHNEPGVTQGVDAAKIDYTPPDQSMGFKARQESGTTGH